MHAGCGLVQHRIWFGGVMVVLAAVLLLTAASAQTSREPGPRAKWTAAWIAHPTAPLREPAVFHFRKVIRLAAQPEHFRVHVSADNRFVLYVNGERIGEGPAGADLAHWRYETLDLAPALKSGDNVIAAVVWQYGVYAPLAQFSDRAAFMIEGDTATEAPATTDETWEVEHETGHTFLPRRPGPESFWDGYTAAGPSDRIEGATANWDWKTASTRGAWVKAALAIRENIYRSASVASSRGVAFESSWALVPDPLPPMEYLPTSVGRIVRTDGGATMFPTASMTIPARTTATILLDRASVTTAYPELTVSGGRGALITLRYAEALYDDKRERHDRNAVANLALLSPFRDEFLPDGSDARTFAPLWWRTWRYLEISVKTADEPLRLEALRAYFTAYPFVERARISADDPDLAKIWAICWHGLRLSAHENYVDTPFWEQLQYVGDTRIEALISYTVANDDRLAVQALRAFDDSRRPDGLTQSRYPSTLPQYIPPFSLLFVNMLHDYWMYRPDPALVRELLPGTRATLQWFLERQRADGFLQKLPYWVFVDNPAGVRDWPPPDAEGRSTVVTLQFIGALQAAAEMEDALGENRYAQAYRERAKRASEAVFAKCWNPGYGLLADTPEQKTYSQHANLYGVLFEVVPQARQAEVMRKVLSADVAAYHQAGLPALTHVSYFFTFYLARAMQHAGFGNDYLQVIKPWREMPARGLTSTPEYPDPTRSDTHAWSAHPAYDFLTIVAGIAPAAPGFSKVRITPGLGAQKEFSATMPHPAGNIETSYKRTGSSVDAVITLPKGLSGTFLWNGREYALNEGAQAIHAK